MGSFDLLYHLGVRGADGRLRGAVYEEPRYEVLARIDHRTEIRRYAPRLAIQVELPQADRRGRDEAFRALFAYTPRGASPDLKIKNSLIKYRANINCENEA